MFRLTQLSCLSICVLSCQFRAFAEDDRPVEAPVPSSAKPQAKNARAAAGGIVVRRAGGNTGISGIREDADPQDPKERFLLLTPGGPIVIEASIYVDGQPFRIAREELTAKQMKAADTDGDGKATWDEAVANPRFGFGRFTYYARNKAQLQATIKRYDLNKDGLVDKAEARSLVASLGGGGAVFRVVQGATAYSQPDIKKLLDADGDGVIGQQELETAPDKLKSRDANDNDLLEPNEAGGGAVRNQYRNIQIGGRRTTVRRGTTAFLLGPSANLVTIYTAMAEKYAGDDKQIRADDFRWFSQMVNDLDLDQSGTLDSGELVGLHLVKPHIAIDVNLGKSEQRPAGLRIAAIVEELGDLNRFSKEFGSQIVIERPGMKLTLSAPKVSNRYAANYGRSAKSMLTRYDLDKNGYIDKEEIKKVTGANQQYLVKQFERWDADGNGMVFAKEIEAAYLEQLAPRMTAVMATSTHQGPSFFNALDETGDNRLSLREMKIAAKRLATFDKNADGKLGVEEMPVELSVTFTRGIGYSNRGRGGRVTTRPVRPNVTANTPQVPDWFTRMDRNGDGDLTMREFLGGEEKFDELDTNGDGFIERAEAAAVASK